MMTKSLSLLLLVLSFSIHSQQSAKELIDSLNSIKGSQKKAELCRKIAFIIQNSDWDRAIKYIELAETEAKNSQIPESTLANVYITAGKMYSSKEVLDIALQYYLKAYDIYKKNGNLDEASKIENNLAIIYAQGKSKEKAVKYFLNVYRYQKLKNDPIKLVKVLNNIGTIYLSKNLDSSLYYYQKAHLINKTIKDNVLKIYVFTNLARTYALKKKQ